jgi:hypothetical protein
MCRPGRTTKSGSRFSAFIISNVSLTQKMESDTADTVHGTSEDSGSFIAGLGFLGNLAVNDTELQAGSQVGTTFTESSASRQAPQLPSCLPRSTVSKPVARVSAPSNLARQQDNGVGEGTTGFLHPGVAHITNGSFPAGAPPFSSFQPWSSSHYSQRVTAPNNHLLGMPPGPSPEHNMFPMYAGEMPH